MKHKWHDEIVAWAGGAEIEIYYDAPHYDWCPIPSIPEWKDNQEYRIKPTPKEPQDLSSKSYLYVYQNTGSREIHISKKTESNIYLEYIGKIPFIGVDDAV